jgi:hypothetical protein
MAAMDDGGAIAYGDDDDDGDGDGLSPPWLLELPPLLLRLLRLLLEMPELLLLWGWEPPPAAAAASAAFSRRAYGVENSRCAAGRSSGLAHTAHVHASQRAS